jgi:YHS domain-containing protein
MSRLLTILAVVSTLILGGALTATAQEKKPPAEKEPPAKTTQPALPKCPVLGEEIDISVSVATDDGPVYFCCADCIKKYQADPKKYADKVAEQRKALANLAKVQVTCPVSGKPVDPKMFTEKDGKKVYFCCPNCKPKYEAEPAQYASKLANSYVYQTKCPVSGEAISPQAFTELVGGQKIYFCCKDCSAKLLKEPAKYLPNLEKQGIHLKAEEVKAKG